jgi:hypothetical protein
METTMRLRNGLCLAMFGLFASCGLSAQQPTSGSAGGPVADAQCAGVIDERSEFCAPGANAMRRDGAAGTQASGETAVAARAVLQR